MGVHLVHLIGGPAPYREALTARLEAADIELGEADVDAVVACCTTDHLWGQAADFALWVPTVIVITELSLDLFVRALALGAGVVHLDTPTEIMVDVIRAAIAGEALLPLSITRALALHEPPTQSDIVGVELEGVENEIAEAILAGHGTARMATQFSYSERTIRRKLQGIYLKLGAKDRTEAISALRERRAAERET